MSEEIEKKTSEQAKKFFLVGLLSAAAGAVTALLLTPWKGAEARAKVKEGAAKAGAAAKEGAAKAAEAAKAAREKAAELARRAKREQAEEETDSD